MPREPHEGLTRRERQIMDVLFRSGKATVADVMDQMPDPPSYSAVRATLRVLEEKGRVLHQQDGPRYVYVPAVPAETARSAALHHLVNTFFDGSAERAVAALLQLDDANVSETDLARLSALVKRARDEGR
ncbi:MAG TPA: BlaI/MecI/CopY family transcriptional regulator [Gemmatimonadales bacterium]|nr:BlaI/MecI/CopY family transcriptional regulator [Gemmatimonadales bacterium]